MANATKSKSKPGNVRKHHHQLNSLNPDVNDCVLTKVHAIHSCHGASMCVCVCKCVCAFACVLKSDMLQPKLAKIEKYTHEAISDNRRIFQSIVVLV